MKMRLTKTLLSHKPKEIHFIWGFISFLLLLLIHSLDTSDWMANGHNVFKQHEYWKLFTSSLIHADFTHLGHNAFFFTGLVILLNGYFGWLIFPVISLIMGALINLITLKFYPPEVYLVGISGVIYFMAAFWMVMYIGTERSLSLKRRLINTVAVSLIFLFPQAFEVKVSYLAHGVGFGMGLAVALPYFFMRKKFIRSFEVWEVVPNDPNIISLEDYNYATVEESDTIST